MSKDEEAEGIAKLVADEMAKDFPELDRETVLPGLIEEARSWLESQPERQDQRYAAMEIARYVVFGEEEQPEPHSRYVSHEKEMAAMRRHMASARLPESPGFS